MFVYEITFSPTGGRKRFRITLQNLLAGKACVGGAAVMQENARWGRFLRIIRL